MRRILLLMVCWFGLGFMVEAQEPVAATPTTAPVRTPDQLVKYYDSKLSLSEAQKVQLKPIIADRQQRMMALRSDTSSRPMMKARRMKALSEEEDKKIKGVLTGDQWTKYQAMEAEAKEKMKEKRAGG